MVLTHYSISFPCPARPLPSQFPDKRTCKTGLSSLGYTQRLCQPGAEEGSDVEERVVGGVAGLREPGMLIGKIVLIRPSSLQMLGEGSLVGPHRQGGSSQRDIVSKHNRHNMN